MFSSQFRSGRESSRVESVKTAQIGGKYDFDLARKRAIILAMPAAPGATRAVGMVPDDEKSEPRSKGLTTPRKKKPKELAVITECCTGCAGSSSSPDARSLIRAE